MKADREIYNGFSAILDDDTVLDGLVYDLSVKDRVCSCDDIEMYLIVDVDDDGNFWAYLAGGGGTSESIWHLKYESEKSVKKVCIHAYKAVLSIFGSILDNEIIGA